MTLGTAVDAVCTDITKRCKEVNMYSLNMDSLIGEEEVITYCELFKCNECPKYGDDCDGKEDDDDTE